MRTSLWSCSASRRRRPAHEGPLLTGAASSPHRPFPAFLRPPRLAILVGLQSCPLRRMGLQARFSLAQLQLQLRSLRRRSTIGPPSTVLAPVAPRSVNPRRRFLALSASRHCGAEGSLSSRRGTSRRVSYSLSRGPGPWHGNRSSAVRRQGSSRVAAWRALNTVSCYKYAWRSSKGRAWTIWSAPQCYTCTARLLAENRRRYGKDVRSSKLT